MGIKTKLTGSGCALVLVIAAFFQTAGESTKVSEGGLTHLIECEGCTKQPYIDIAGVPTDGVGNTRGVVMGKLITDDKVGRDLGKHVLESEACLRRNVKVEMTQGEYDAWVSFIHHKGCGAFAGSSGRRLLNEGKPIQACRSMLLWDKITVKGKKVFSQGVYNRSAKDAKLCEKNL